METGGGWMGGWVGRLVQTIVSALWEESCGMMIVMIGLHCLSCQVQTTLLAS